MEEFKKIPLIVIVGPTASGKSDLAINVAKQINGEIISADSMQIYKYMNIGTAKPSFDEMQGVRHHLIDIIEPNESFSVAQFCELAKIKIEEIVLKGKTPILVGGTGLYIDSLIQNVNFDEIEKDENLRNELRKKAKEFGNEALLEELSKIDSEIAEKLHPNNLNRIIRAIEIFKITGINMSEHQKRSKQIPSKYSTCIIGLNFLDRSKLYDRINKRVDLMIENGLIEEAKNVLALENTTTAAQAIAYKELDLFFKGEQTLEQATDKLKQATRNYAKRQLTWFRANESINWIYLDEIQTNNQLLEVAMKIINNSKVV